jgi:hypothetical protein
MLKVANEVPGYLLQTAWLWVVKVLHMGVFEQVLDM